MKHFPSITDYIIMKRNTSVLVKKFYVKRGPECRSDNNLVAAKLGFPWNWFKLKNNKHINQPKEKKT